MTGTFTPAQLTAKCLAHGVSAIALQYPENHDYFADFRHPGIWVGAWEAEPIPGSAADCHAMVAPDFYIAQAEGPRDWEGIDASVSLHCPRLPHAIVTNFGSLDVEIGEFLSGEGWACLTESYEVENPLATPERQEFEARQRGFSDVQAVAGCYHGFPLEHTGAKTPWVWLAETMTDADWSCWA